MKFTRELIRLYCDDGLTGIMARWIGEPISLTAIARMIEGTDEERKWLASVLYQDYPNDILEKHIPHIRRNLIARAEVIAVGELVPVSGCLVAANGHASIAIHSEDPLDLQVNEIMVDGIHYYPERSEKELADLIKGFCEVVTADNRYDLLAEKVLHWIKSHNKAVRRGDQ